MAVSGPIAEGLHRTRERIARACARCGRDESTVELVAVSKRNPSEAIREAYAAGQRSFGENYVQELVEKATELADLTDLRWHLIGHLQRNKAKQIVPLGAVVQTVDSARLADELDKRAREAGLISPVLVQVDVAGEAQKSGCEPDALPALVEHIRRLGALELRGLMTIPPLEAAPESNRPRFAMLRQLAEANSLRELSMGMSADVEVAIEEGATIVRVGTAIFGARDR